MGLNITLQLECVRLTEDNLEEVERFLKGNIKGTLLPPAAREIEYRRYDDREDRIEVGDWAVKSQLGFMHVSDDVMQDFLTNKED
jgi:hypothetical protein